jgi:predicted permease
VLPAGNDLHVDTRLVLFTLALGVLSTLLFALAPALQAAGRRPADALARGGRSAAGGRHLLQRSLVGIQVGLALVLLVGAGLLGRSFARLQAIDPGIHAQDVVTFRMTASWSERLEAVEQRQARTVARLEAIPGVRAAAFTQLLPIDGDYPPQEFVVTGRDYGGKTFAHGRMVSAGYFRTLGIPMLEGGTCDATPGKPSRMKAVVSQSFADRFFASDTAIGRHIRTVSMPPGDTMEIVGVVADVRERGIARPVEPIIYHCGFNGYWPDMFYMVSLDPVRPAGIPALRAALKEIEPARALYSIRPLDAVIQESMAQSRLNATLLAMFAATALALAAMGIYGVLSQLVAARRREIGVRLALGAAPSRIVRSVAAQAATVTAVGILAGLAAAAAAARFMGSLVFEVRPHDPLTFALVPAVLAVVAAVAALVPARRASRVDPVEVLRS